MYGDIGLEIAKRANAFEDESSQWEIGRDGQGHHAEPSMVGRIMTWDKTDENDLRRTTFNESGDMTSDVRPLTVECNEGAHVEMIGNEQWLNGLEQEAMGRLKEDQLHAFEIIRWHLEKTLHGQRL